MFARNDIFPFGDRQIMVVDFWHQYYPFLSDYWHKLREGTSLLWSWTGGAGHDYIAHIAYYLASPLNLLAVLFPHSILREVVTASLLIKIGFAGLFMSLYLRYVSGRRDILLPAFASLYALCAFTLGYYWNIMWFDTFAMMPLVMLGVRKLMREGKYRVFILALTCAALFNYYLAFFVCIFVAILFFLTCYSSRYSLRETLLKTGIIAACSAIALGMTGFLTVPVYNALSQSYRAGCEFPSTMKFITGFPDIIGNFIAFTPPTTMEGLPNLYSGLISVMLFPMFLMSPKISRREKIGYSVVIAFLVLSCNVNVLDYIWHGFSITNMLPFRFSFLVSFTMIVMAYRAVPLLKNMRQRDLIAMAVTGVLFMTMAMMGRQDNKHVLWSAILCGIYLVLFAVSESSSVGFKRTLQKVIFVAIIVELAVTANTGVSTVGSTDRVDYPPQYEEVMQLLSERELTGGDFYRTEFTKWRTINDSSLYGTDGLSLFSSSANVSMSHFMKGLGLQSWDRANRYFYAETSPLANAFLSVRYQVCRDGQPIDDGVYWDRVSSSGQSLLMENNRHLPLGFMVRDEVADYKGDKVNPYNSQNDLFRRATGLDGDLFTLIDIVHVDHKDYIVHRNDLGDYTYSQDGSTTGGSFKWNYEIPEDCLLYAYVSIDGVNNADFLLNETVLRGYETRRPYIMPVGEFIEGDLISISASSRNRSGSAKVFVAMIDRELFDRGYDLLATETFRPDVFSETRISGSVTALSDGLLYTSIPHGNYWSAFVDGAEVRIETIDGAMAAVWLNAGEHTVEFRYSNDYLTIGLIVSGVSLLLFLALVVFDYVSRRRGGTTLLEAVLSQYLPAGVGAGRERRRGHRGRKRGLPILGRRGKH